MEPAPLPPHIRIGPFSTRDAHTAGVSSSRLRRRDLARPFHGVRVVRDEFSPLRLHDRCAAYSARMDAIQFFSHTTAALLWGLPLNARHEEMHDLHVAVVAPRRAPKARGVIGHRVRLDPRSLLVRDGLRVPRPAEVWCQLASYLTLTELVQAGDALLRRSNPLVNIDELRSTVGAAANRPGVRHLRQALELLRARTDSPMESLLRLALVRSGLREPIVNYRIVDGDGTFVAFGDLVYPHERVVVEYDGDHHRRDFAQYAADIDRLWKIERLGWTVVRINKSHITEDAREAVARVRTALRR